MTRSDDWYTPKHVFDALGCHFDLDVATDHWRNTHVPCNYIMSKHHDGLESDWGMVCHPSMLEVGQTRPFVWMNPPYGHQSTKREWLRRFVDNGNGIALMPDRTSAPWFQEFAPKMDALFFWTPKIKFERPDGSIGEQPGNGTCLMGIGKRALEAFESAAKAGCGMAVTPWLDKDGNQ